MADIFHCPKCNYINVITASDRRKAKDGKVKCQNPFKDCDNVTVVN